MREVITDGAGMGESHDEHYIVVPRYGKKPLDYSLAHVHLDNIHYAMGNIFGLPAWGRARDVMREILKENGSIPPFHVAINSAIQIIMPEFILVPIPVLICLLNFAWIWVTFSNQKIIHDE